ncbi:hypothetical protein [Serratia fonticola]|uniref:hypothetical protein n=1 Tax=Serratia fonticola TaxID=47917 RepID=UPI001377138F|nr:hypothetical protein [Serratia fonticola]NCG53445.1 hypothetical protein [Serratia fonticola]
MIFADKPDRNKRWVTVVVNANKDPVHSITKELSWHKTLIAYGIPHAVAIRYIELRGEANRATEGDPDMWLFSNMKALKSIIDSVGLANSSS